MTGLLQLPDGAILAEVMKATGWQAHPCWGALSTMKAKSVARAESQGALHTRGREVIVPCKGGPGILEPLHFS